MRPRVTMRGRRILALGVLGALCCSLVRATMSEQAVWGFYNPSDVPSDPFSSRLVDKRPSSCPPCPEPSCFNCKLPKFNCAQFGDCRDYDGQCTCPVGFGGQDCLSPLCGSPIDGDRRFPKDEEDKNGKMCECAPGFFGLNCNVCVPPPGDANLTLPASSVNPCAEFKLGGERLGENATCYTGGSTINQSFQECAVTNKKITDMLPGRPPRVTFSCQRREEDRDVEDCNFQFWIGPKESFFCGLEDCTETLDRSPASNNTRHECKKARCECIPGRMLCGESGSVDIGDFLQEEIKGPASMTCRSGREGKRICTFEEPGMSQLISDVFGDSAIFLSCDSGECVHYSQVPGYATPLPDAPPVFWVAFSAAAAIVLVISFSIALWFLGRHYKHEESQVRLPEDEMDRLLKEHVPAALHFENVGYSISERTVLDGITGCVKPGQVMAIVGASGAGKSTFLDILADRNKRGATHGDVLVNGRRISSADYKRVVGFVDQEDCLMPTLTVYETVLYSALLRLPREMSLEAKRFRTLETISELGLLGVKDSRVGSAGHRSISGGEKRRVSIACELVTSPSILFCDEPTSGLDSFNAFNVVESLVTLARNYNRTVVFTIHQPRSNIVALFDQLVLLAKGKMVYSGPLSACAPYFEGIGHGCPTGFNLGDHLVDLTAEASLSEKPSQQASTSVSRPLSSAGLSDVRAGDFADEEAAAGSSTELRTRPGSTVDPSNGKQSLRHKTSKLAAGVRNALGSRPLATAQITPRLAALVDTYAKSSVSEELQKEIRSFENEAGSASLPDVSDPERSLQGYEKASLWTQLVILSGRAFKNLYRNPMLMAAHYTMSLVLAVLSGLLYANVTNDIAGFQNRLGLFFFILSLFGFSTLTSLGLFAEERALFVRERANGYYSPITYFFSKLIFDVLPLRVIPPFILGGIVYFLVGLLPSVAAFWSFIAALVLFSLAVSAVVLFISISIKDKGVANLVGSLVMLAGMVSSGFLVNRNSTPWWLQKAFGVSPFRAGLEVLLIVQVKDLTLKEHRYGVDVELPGATICECHSSHALRAHSFANRTCVRKHSLQCRHSASMLKRCLLTCLL
ncbi:hypothetical protein IE81DRAFT_119342 [Ceraceosorus guamensis]|uniref:ABC transporter domain-containing protein n=1 Tax=Ceraceosorus guamensis TaxID=1522189 RepID=A0A316W2B2_9BASI|nr:hypothetical protein IE81DRAFT_119342 [Ceraceosorus guamensis]PWN42701.1 hypothetical protein IE81DRAFT_119342 [Ceraceosorus guamensis]